jgi:hypothetical protein
MMLLGDDIFMTRYP